MKLKFIPFFILCSIIHLFGISYLQALPYGSHIELSPNEQLKAYLKEHPVLMETLDYCQKKLNLGDPDHNFEHSLRVLAIALEIARSEGGDPLILIPATLFQDIKYRPSSDPESLFSLQDAAEFARDFLQQRTYSQEKAQRVYAVILAQAKDSQEISMALEEKILQDSQLLSSLGAVGMARLFQLAGEKKLLLYHQKDPLYKTDRPLDQAHYAVDYFYAKMLKIPARMQTKTASEIALQRLELLEAYLSQLAKEIPLDLRTSVSEQLQGYRSRENKEVKQDLAKVYSDF